ncbi:MAG: type I-E CRISPR-associated protein Cse1/CasA, partial [Chloroflexi bacterium]|nr:type I-E CRISPR-associated protein Cse1/CasA [Chloroflexota bacterium]
ELGLYDVLVRAHTLQGLACEVPTETVAIYRLLLGILHRVFGPADMDAWHRLWQAGRWDPEPLQAYLSRWADRFDLCSPVHPFLQTHDKRVNARWAGDLRHETRSADTLFNHNTDDGTYTLSPARAARALVAMHHFGFAGKKGSKMQFTDASSTRMITFLVRGENLFQSLLLNMPRYGGDSDPLPNSGSDRLWWEADDPCSPPRTVPLGYLDYLTWPNRLLELEWNEQGEVTGLSMGPALRLDGSVLNPLAAFTRSTESGVHNTVWKEGRALWRDATALLASADIVRPRQLDWLAELAEEHDLPLGRLVPVDGYGMCTLGGKDKVYFYRSERLALSSALLADRACSEALVASLSQAETVGTALVRYVKGTPSGVFATLAGYLIAPQQDVGGRQPDSKDVDAMVLSWAGDGLYWAELEVPFQQLAVEIGDDLQAARLHWAQAIRGAAWSAFRSVVQGLPPTPAALKAAVRAQASLGALLKRVLELEEQETAQEEVE